MPEEQLHDSAIDRAFGLASMGFDSPCLQEDFFIAGSNPAERKFCVTQVCASPVVWVLSPETAHGSTVRKHGVS